MILYAENELPAPEFNISKHPKVSLRFMQVDCGLSKWKQGVRINVRFLSRKCITLTGGKLYNTLQQVRVVLDERHL